MNPIINSFEANELSFLYPKSEKYVIKDFSFSINKGVNILLIGDNGSGKSTLGKILCGLLELREGSCLINGTNLNKLSAPKRIQLGYYISQITQLQFVKNSLRGEIKLVENIINKISDKSIYSNFGIPSDLLFNPFELSVNEAWRFLLYLSTIIDPVLLFIDEIPSGVNKNNLDTLQYLMHVRKMQGKFTFLCYQRNIHLQFDSVFELVDSHVIITS